MIRLAKPPVSEAGIEAVRQVLESGQLVQGPVVEEFEHAVAGYAGSQHAVAVSSGTAALHLCLLARGIGPGDAVAVPAYSFPATANVVEIVGARPVFVDIDPSTFNMDPASLRSVLADQPVAAIMPVHEFGMAAAMGEILDLAEAAGAPVVEDAACALGSWIDGKAAGTLGVAGCLSFHPRKIITTGEGGMVLTDDEQLASTLRALRNHGHAAGAAGYEAAGLNYRLPDVLAALGLDQMRRLGDLLRSRRQAAATYRKLLDADTFALPPEGGDRHAYQSYVVRLPGPRHDPPFPMIRELRGRGVECNVGAWHLPLTTYYRERYGYERGDFPGADDAFARALALPMHADLTHAEQQCVAAELMRLSAASAGL